VDNRTEFVEALVLNSIADDYEDFDRVFDEVTEWAGFRGLQLTRNEVADALERAVNTGRAQAFALSTVPPCSTPVSFTTEKLDQLYFLLTPEGRKNFRNLEDLGVSE
jgi:hypothetical protein